MAHVREISSTQIRTLSEVQLEGKPLMNSVDNAGQSLWLALIPTHKPAMKKFAEFAGKPIDAGTIRDMESYSARLISSGLTPAKFPLKTTHEFLSLEHHLLPESEGHAKRAIAAALEHLNMPPVMPPEQLKDKLPALLASVHKTVAAHTKSGGWIG